MCPVEVQQPQAYSLPVPRRSQRLAHWLLASLLLPCIGHAQIIAVQGATDSSVIADAASLSVPGATHQWTFPAAGLAGTVVDVQLQLVLTHAAVGDLKIALIAPDGARLLLAESVGALAGGTPSTADLDGNYLFDDGGGDLWQAAASAGGAVIPQGVQYRPSTAGLRATGGCATWLATVFGGMPAAQANGTWRVETIDQRPANVGGYANAVLRLTVQPPPPDLISASSFEANEGVRPVAAIAQAAITQGATSNCRRPPAYDLDGNGFSDFVVARPTVTPNGDVLRWTYRLNRGNGVDPDRSFDLGRPGDQFASGDYDGDGAWDAALFRPGNPGVYLIRLSSNPDQVRTVAYGSTGEARNVGDYTGDGVFDYAQYNVGSGPSVNGNFLIRDARTGAERPIAISIFWTTQLIGGPDYTGDGIGDLVQRNDNVFQIRDGASSNLGVQNLFGDTSDRLVPGHFGGDPRADVTLTRVFEIPGFSGIRQWSSLIAGGSGPINAALGAAATVPAPGDYDGDGTDDFAVFEILPGNSGSVRYARSGSGGSDTNVIIGQINDLVPASARVR